MADSSCGEVKADTVTLNATEWACIQKAFKRLAAIQQPLQSYLYAHKSRQTAGGERIHIAVQLAWCDLQGAVERVNNEQWLRRQLATLNEEEN